MSSNTASEKPTWLQILEAESWQAELLISGAAILGSLQLPGLLSGLIDTMIFKVPDELGILVYFTFFYMFIAAGTLIVSFLFHFGLRAVWIGMVGLVSVYPEGIKPMKRFSKETMDRLLKDFGDVNGYIQGLDRLCSTIFAAAFALVMMFLSITLLLVFSYIIGYLVISFLPQVPLFYLMLVALGLFFIPSVAISMMNMKSLRERPWVKKWQYPLSQIYAKTFYGVFYRPISYILNIFSSNVKPGRLVLVVSFGLILSMFIASQFFMNSNIFLLFPGKFETMDYRADRVYGYNYADRIPEGVVYAHPVLDSEVIEDGSHLRVFLPLFNRERRLIKKQCGDFPGPDSDSELTSREQSRAYWLECYRNSYQIMVNDSIRTDYSMKFHDHPNRGEPGLLLYIGSPNLVQGENQLQIKHSYVNEDGEPKIDRIPFYYFGTE